MEKKSHSVRRKAEIEFEDGVPTGPAVRTKAAWTETCPAGREPELNAPDAFFIPVPVSLASHLGQNTVCDGEIRCGAALTVVPHGQGTMVRDVVAMPSRRRVQAPSRAPRN